MSDRPDTQPSPHPAGWQGTTWNDPKTGVAGPAQARDESALSRFLGGSPVAVLTRLLLMSLVVGAMLVWLDIHPFDIFRGFERLFYRLWYMGFDAVREVGSYILAGALLVVPIWLLLRLMNMKNR